MTIAENALSVIQSTFACDTAVAEVVRGKASFRHYEARAPLISAGDTVSRAFLIIAGRAREMALSLDGRMVLVQEFAAGDLFGEASILGDHLASEEIVAVDPTDAGRFQSGDLIGLIENYSSIALSFSKLMTRRLRSARQRMVEGATLTASGRIHAELLRQARSSISSDSNTALCIRPAPVLTEFALIVQTSRETVSRAISALEKLGIITRDAASLIIVAPHRLEELVF